MGGNVCLPLSLSVSISLSLSTSLLSLSISFCLSRKVIGESCFKVQCEKVQGREGKQRRGSKWLTLGELTHQNIFVQPKCAVLFLDCLNNITQTFVVNNSPSVAYEVTQVIKQTKMF